jgi:hypothetical protein
LPDSHGDEQGARDVGRQTRFAVVALLGVPLARRAAISGAVSARRSNRRSPRILIAPMGLLALGFAFYPVEVAVSESA